MVSSLAVVKCRLSAIVRYFPSATYGVHLISGHVQGTKRVSCMFVDLPSPRHPKYDASLTLSPNRGGSHAKAHTTGIGGVRSAILILSSLIIAAIGVLQAPPCSAAEADDVNSSAVATHASAANEAAALVRVSESYGKLPLSFEANRGQTDPEVKFLARSTGHMLFLASTEAVLVFTKPEYPGGERRDPRAKLEKPRKATQTVLRMTFLGANLDARVTGREELPGKANYFIGNDPAKWRTNVPTYAKVHSVDLYPGIDLVFYGNQRQLEYDFAVHPGDDPSSIALSFQGADKVEVDAQGDLVLHMPAGAIRQRTPVIYPSVAAARREIAGG